MAGEISKVSESLEDGLAGRKQEQEENLQRRKGCLVAASTAGAPFLGPEPGQRHAQALGVARAWSV